MRATLTLDDEIVFALTQRALQERKAFEEVANAVLRLELALAQGQLQPKPYRLEPSSMGGVLPGVDLDKALRLASELEDDAISRQLGLAM